MNIFTSAIVGLCVCALTVWMSIQIKFAESKGQVIETYKKVFSQIIYWGALLWNVHTFWQQLTSSAPLTRVSVAMMIGSAVTVHLLVLVWLWDRLMTVVEKHVVLTLGHSVVHKVSSSAISDQNKEIAALRKKVEELSKAQSNPS